MESLVEKIRTQKWKHGILSVKPQAQMGDWKESGTRSLVFMEAYEDDYYLFYFSVFSIYLTVLCYM